MQEGINRMRKKWKERIEALELANKQHDCSHFFRQIVLEPFSGSGPGCHISSECYICGHLKERCVSGEEIAKTMQMLKEEIGK